MARGWESKAVEEQVAEKQMHIDNRKGLDAAALKQRTLEKADKDRARQSLELQRERVLSERTASPHRRAALVAALEQIEAQIQQLA
jgi:hypothetical protein